MLLAVVNLMVSADVMSDDNVAKGKREAPMAEPSTEYLPPRLEAPYATYQPILAGGTVPQTVFYQQNPYNQQSPFSQQNPYNQQNSFNQVSSTAAPAYEYNRYAGVIPLQTVDNNDLGNGLHPGPPYNSNAGLNSGYGNRNTNANFNNGNINENINGNTNLNNENVGDGFGNVNSYGSFVKYGQNGYPTSYAQVNGLGHSLNVYDNNGNGFGTNSGQFEQYSTIKNSHFGDSGANLGNSYYGSPSFSNTGNKYPSSSALISNEPVYASGVKGLSHYSTPGVSNVNAQPLKNSRPVALQPAHLQRKPPSFLSEARNPNFRPSFLLGSQVLSSTPDYNQETINQQPQLTSLGTTGQYIPPTQQFPQQFPQQYINQQSIGALPLAQREYLPAPVSNIPNGYQNVEQPITYGLPETIIYTKSSLFGDQYGPSQ